MSDSEEEYCADKMNKYERDEIRKLGTNYRINASAGVIHVNENDNKRKRDSDDDDDHYKAVKKEEESNEESDSDSVIFLGKTMNNSYIILSSDNESSVKGIIF